MGNSARSRDGVLEAVENIGGQPAFCLRAASFAQRSGKLEAYIEPCNHSTWHSSSDVKAQKIDWYRTP